MSFAIELDSVSKFYRDGFWLKKTQALFDLSLQVPRGEIFGFVGPNGAGKTTTIKILAGLHEASSGQAKLFGHSVSHKAAKAALGFLPERPYFYTHLSPRELLHFYGQLYALPQKTRQHRIHELLERSEMLPFIDVPMKNFSKGMLQRIGLCQCLLHKPDLLILDEPMSGLDPLGRALVRDIILEEHARGAAIFFSSHVLSDVERICNRVAILVKGHLRSVNTVEELTSSTKKNELIMRAPKGFPKDWSVKPFPGGLFRMELSPEDTQRHLEQLSQYHIELLELRPIRHKLEDILVEEIKKDVINPHRMGVWT